MAAISEQSIAHSPPTLRAPDVVMDLARLGSLYPYRLSFMRSLIRRIMAESWQINRTSFDLDEDGYGTAIYEVTTPNNLFSFVAFAHYLDPAERSDRVIADAWDMTVTLCIGSVDATRLEFLRANVPLQEKGRLDSNCIVLSRANKSARNFDYVVDCLAKGEQPCWETIAKVGYLYRTTAVYGSGKFGMADWRKVSGRCPDFASPFAAEMFSCFMIRQFSLEQADHIAASRSPESAAPMDPAMKRFMGIGNATGLGMAPYLINHPLLISNWIEVRETALARALEEPLHASATSDFLALAKKAMRHLAEIATDNHEQNQINDQTRRELGDVVSWVTEHQGAMMSWQVLADHVAGRYGLPTQELINTLLIELYPGSVDDLERALGVEEEYALAPEMDLDDLMTIISDRYSWALEFDFSHGNAEKVFWYRSEEKMEPRLGQRGEEPGDDREMLIGIARAVRACYDAVRVFDQGARGRKVAHFVLAHPEHRLIIRRIQTMSKTTYGDIRANLLDADVLPIHLLRCKLSFFGVSKFDPRSRLWVRNTMFQGAPISSDLGASFKDDWCFPIIPVAP